MGSNFLPTRVPSYLRRLIAQYARTNPPLQKVVAASRVLVIEETAYDNWNGGMDGHDVRLYVPPDILGEIDVDKQDATTTLLHDDLRKLAQGSGREYINAVQLEMAEDDDPDYRRAIGLSAEPSPNPDQLGIWQEGHVRVFISHRNQHRAAAHQLCRALQNFGFTCFVAHDTIPANQEWRRTILNGLETMEVLLAFITDDFADSAWTMQELGYALGKGVPVVSLKLESKDPPGFISERQALRGSLDRPSASAAELFTLIAYVIGGENRIQTALVNAFTESRSFEEARDRFKTMARFVEKLTDAELSMITSGYHRNNQLHHSIYLANSSRLISFLNDSTGREFTIYQRAISEVQRPTN